MRSSRRSGPATVRQGRDRTDRISRSRRPLALRGPHRAFSRSWDQTLDRGRWLLLRQCAGRVSDRALQNRGHRARRPRRASTTSRLPPPKGSTGSIAVAVRILRRPHTSRSREGSLSSQQGSGRSRILKLGSLRTRLGGSLPPGLLQMTRRVGAARTQHQIG